MAISRRGFSPRAGFPFFDGVEWVRRLHSPRLGAIDIPPQLDRVETTRQAVQAAHSSRQQQVIDRLLVAKTDSPVASYESLPSLFEAPDLLTNPRLAPLVAAIDSRLLAPLYSDIDHHNSRLKFFLTGQEHLPASSFYVRSFLPHFHLNNLFYLNREGLERKDTDGLPWQPLHTLMTDVFASIGVTELRDFYTHVLPARVGRHAPHRDRLQSGTWKVDIRWSPHWTELLFLDAEDARWYALRFPPGGSGFVIDSALFRRFHAVRAGPAIQQSVLLVFNQQGSTMQMVREAFAARANALPALPRTVPMPIPVPNGILPTLMDAAAATAASDGETDVPVDAAVSMPSSERVDRIDDDSMGGGGGRAGALGLFAFPVATARHPRSVESLRVTKQRAVSFRNSVQRLRAAVLAIDARHWLRVPQSVIDQAVATFPEDERAGMLQTFNQCKVRQHFAFGVDRSTSICADGHRQLGRTLRRNIDDRHVSIQGSATVEGKAFHFPAYDGTEATRLWFGWQRYGMRYRTTASMSSSNELSASLAAVVARRIRPQANGTYCVELEIDGDSIVGDLATWLREIGLTLQVMRLEGELDNQTKRVRELERVRAPGPVRRARPFFLTDRAPIRVPWMFFLAERSKVAKKAFLELTAEDRKVYENKAAADKARYQVEKSKLGETTPRRPGHAFFLFVGDHPGMGVKKGSLAWAQLTPQEKESYQAKSRTKLQEWRRLTAEVRVKRPRTAYGYFMQDYFKASKLMYDRLSPAERGVYEDKAREGRQRYEAQESQWSAANQQAPNTAFEVFRAETSPALLQSDSSKFSGREGQRRLNRELRVQWQRLSRSDWAEYERKLQRQGDFMKEHPPAVPSASNLAV